MRHTHPLFPTALALLLANCGGQPPGPVAPTAEDARTFVARADMRLREAWVERDEADWAYLTDITDENEAKSAKANEKAMGVLSDLVKESRLVQDAPDLDEATARQLMLLKVSTALPAPDDEAKRARLAEIASKIAGIYAKGEYCLDGYCRDLEELTSLLAKDRDYDAQLDAWLGWRTISPPMRDLYTEFVTLGNEGARDIGFADMGELWRSGYDMPPDAVEKEADRLVAQVAPLYEQLHCYTRARLVDLYGPERVPPDGLIPAHLTGNMWAQDWSNLYPVLEPYPGVSAPDVGDALKAQGYDPVKMVKTAEAFFTSIGLDPLPQTFWERSMLTKPADREVECHASAWDVGWNDDLRIKMCIEPTAEDLETIHHELGHNYYYHYYYQLPILFQAGANDGFHEAIGDAITLSMTPGYLKEIGLIDEIPSGDQATVNQQMLVALNKIAFMPFGRMIDQWRWDVFSGKTPPEHYNEHWWELRQKYQGIAPPVARTEADFDPGAKYHIPANTPYLRYFLALVLQFQFHAAMCEAAGFTGPLHECSIYGNKEAGEKLKALLELGASKPWPDALEAMTGSREMDAGPLLAYFKPLSDWLEEQNQGRQCGW